MSYPKIRPNWLENFHITIMDKGELMIFDSWKCPINDLIFIKGGLAKDFKLTIKGHEFTCNEITIQGSGFEPSPYGKHDIRLIIYTAEHIDEEIYDINGLEILNEQ